MFVDLGIKSDSGNKLLWETENWWPENLKPQYFYRPAKLPEEQFYYVDPNSRTEYLVTARYPSIKEWERLVKDVTLKKPKDYYDATTWHYKYPHNSNVYRASNGKEICFRTGTYFCSIDDASVDVLDERSNKHNPQDNLLRYETFVTLHKGYVRRVVEIAAVEMPQFYKNNSDSHSITEERYKAIIDEIAVSQDNPTQMSFSFKTSTDVENYLSNHVFVNGKNKLEFVQVKHPNGGVEWVLVFNGKRHLLSPYSQEDEWGHSYTEYSNPKIERFKETEATIALYNEKLKHQRISIDLSNNTLYFKGKRYTTGDKPSNP